MKVYHVDIVSIDRIFIFLFFPPQLGLDWMDN